MKNGVIANFPLDRIDNKNDECPGRALCKHCWTTIIEGEPLQIHLKWICSCVTKNKFKKWQALKRTFWVGQKFIRMQEGQLPPMGRVMAEAPIASNDAQTQLQGAENSTESSHQENQAPELNHLSGIVASATTNSHGAGLNDLIESIIAINARLANLEEELRKKSSELLKTNLELSKTESKVEMLEEKLKGLHFHCQVGKSDHLGEQEECISGQLHPSPESGLEDLLPFEYQDIPICESDSLETQGSTGLHNRREIDSGYGSQVMSSGQARFTLKLINSTSGEDMAIVFNPLRQNCGKGGDRKGNAPRSSTEPGPMDIFNEF